MIGSEFRWCVKRDKASYLSVFLLQSVSYPALKAERQPGETAAGPGGLKVRAARSTRAEQLGARADSRPVGAAPAAPSLEASAENSTEENPRVRPSERRASGGRAAQVSPSETTAAHLFFCLFTYRLWGGTRRVEEEWLLQRVYKRLTAFIEKVID